jgi:hypothetical protein
VTVAAVDGAGAVGAAEAVAARKEDLGGATFHPPSTHPLKAINAPMIPADLTIVANSLAALSPVDQSSAAMKVVVARARVTPLPRRARPKSFCFQVSPLPNIATGLLRHRSHHLRSASHRNANPK